MKVKSTLAILIFSFCTILNAQTDRNSSAINGTGNVKDRFVRNQDYLAPTTRDYKNVYGDSLKGFDEAVIKARVAHSNVYGTEYQLYLQTQKRAYIDKKYSIGQFAPKPALVINNAPSKGKGNTNLVLSGPCVNEGFEATTPGAYTGSTNSLAINGWTVESQSTSAGCGIGSTWNPGSPKCWILTTPLSSTGLPGLTTLGQSPLGGSNIIQINDDITPYYLRTKISQTFPVTQQNTLFQFAYAGVWDDGGHSCCEQPALQIAMQTCSGTVLSCSSLSLNASGTGCPNGANGYSITGNVSWTNWVVKYIDLTPYLGSCVTIEFINSDCIYGGHWGSAFFDVACGGQLVGTGIGGAGGGVAGPVSFCAGSNQAMISAPFGYSTYQWVAPSGTVAAPAGTMQVLTITNPQPGSVYTVNMTSPSGCQFVSTNTLSFSNVNVAGIGSSSTCPNGASGQATVVGNGSGTGYNYTWTAVSSGSVVGNSSVAVNLAPGVYSVVINGVGAAGCGTAGATTTVGVASPSVTSYLKPFCNNEAYLQSTGGFGHKWYAGTSLITGSIGTLPNFTVSQAYSGISPVANAVYWLSYTTPQGCKDSIKFTLVQSAPGLIVVPPPKVICVGATNGTATVNMSPAPGAPGGFNYFQVSSTGTMTPYTQSVNPTSATTFTVNGLQKGQYSVTAFDGSCKYNTTFNITELVWDFALGPQNTILCPGKNVPVAVTFPTPQPGGPWTYKWTPTNWLVGGNGTLPNTIVTPTGIPQGTFSTVIHTVQVTPTAANCPVTHTFVVTAVNPPTPQFEPINPLCNTFAPAQITVVPTGGTFVNASATPSVVNSTGLITPSLGVYGVNSVTYNIVYNTCPATNSTTFQVSKFNTAALTSTVPDQCVTNAPYNLMNIVQSAANGTWSGTGVTGGTTFNPGTPGLTTLQYQLVYKTTSSPNPATCPDQAITSVNVTNTLVPAISKTSVFCNNAAPFTMTVTPTGGGWFGSNISPSGVVTPSTIANPGINNVTYTVKIGPCLNTAVSSFTVEKYNTAKIISKIPELCENSSNPFNLMTVVSNTTGIWYIDIGGNKSVVKFGILNPKLMATNTYTLFYETKSTPYGDGGCNEADQATVSVLNPPTPVITAIGPLCSADAPVQLSVTPNSGNWSTTPFLNSNGFFSPGLASVGNNVVQYVIGTSTCFAQSTRFINVEAFVPATITVPKLPDVCNTGAGINLTPFTVSSLGTWVGPGISGTNFNPGVAGKGDFVLTHTTASSPSGLCPDQATVAVSVHSLAVPVISTVERVCNNASPVQLHPTPVGGSFGGVNTQAIDEKGLFIPPSAIIGDNIISYSISAGPCVAYAQTTLVVEKFVSADFDHYPSAFCDKANPVNMNSFAQNPGGLWIGKGIVPGTSMFDPKLADLGDNNEITYITSSETKTLCPHTNKVRLVIVDMPKVQPVAEYAQSCAPVIVKFNVPSTMAGDREWILGDGSDSKTGMFVEHVYSTPGSYTVALNFRYEGCTTQVALANPIVVYEVPKADFTMPDELLISSPELQLTNLSSALGNNKYSWFISGGVGTIDGEVNPKVTLPKIGKYQVTLTAETENQCKDEVTKTIEVKNHFNIFIPTSFTPNYDGLNDDFKPVFSEFGLDQRQYEMEIFDRWGHVLFHSKDPNKGWDGSVQNKGEPLKEEVYVYRIKYKDMDGNAYTKMGHVSLVK